MDIVQRFRSTEPRYSIRDLSSELIFMIMDHLPFPTQFDLACTCKQLAVASRGVLERHRDAWRKYRTASDLDPDTVPILLRSAFGQGDPIAAWHVRSFEVWRDRKTWSEWRAFDLHTPLIARPDNDPVQFRVSEEQARHYLHWFEEQLGDELDSELLETFLAQIRAGHDGLLKALLFAKLERLRDLKFVTLSQEAGSCLTSLKLLIAECIRREASYNSPGNDDDSSSDGDNDSEDVDRQETGSDERLLVDSSEQHSTTANAQWPTGYCGIRNVAVGVHSGTWMDDNRDVYNMEPSIALFSRLLRLPSLNSIYFNKLYIEMDSDEDEEDEEELDYWVLPKGSSSVEHIFLHGCDGYLGEAEKELWKAPRNLLTMSIRHDTFETFDSATGTANLLAHAQKDSLQSLMWYGYRGGCGPGSNITGDHCSILDNEEFDHLKRLPAIRQFSCSTQDILLCMEHADTYQCLRFDPHEDRHDDDDQGNIYDEKKHSEFIARRVATMFPRQIEILVLWDRLDDEGMANLIERGLIKMIQGGQYKNLKAIYLEATERATDGLQDERAWYQDAVAAGAAAGVDVHTLTNRENMRHAIEFVEAPDEYDLVSGIHSGVRPSDWTFDPYLGRRLPPGSTGAEYEALWAKHDATRSAYHAAES